MEICSNSIKIHLFEGDGITNILGCTIQIPCTIILQFVHLEGKVLSRCLVVNSFGTFKSQICRNNLSPLVRERMTFTFRIYLIGNHTSIIVTAFNSQV